MGARRSPRGRALPAVAGSVKAEPPGQPRRPSCGAARESGDRVALALEQAPLGGVSGQAEGGVVGRGRVLGASKPGQQVGSSGVVQVVAV